MNRAKHDNAAYQADYRKTNKVRLLAQRRERYADKQRVKGKTVRPNKTERLDIEKSDRTQNQRDCRENKKPPKIKKVVVAQEELGLPKKIDKSKYYTGRIDLLYKRLDNLNPWDDECEAVYGEINNLEIKLLHCKK